MKNLLLMMVPLLVLASCAPPKPDRRDLPPVPRVQTTPDVAPEGRKVRDSAREAASTGQQVSSSVTRLREELNKSRTAESRAKDELDRLIDQQGATVAELNDLKDIFTEQRQRNMFLELETEKLEKTVDDHVAKLQDLTAKADDLEEKLVAKDREVDDWKKSDKQLRDNLASAENSLEEERAYSAGVEKERDTAKGRVKELEGEIKIWRRVGYGIAAAIVIFLFVKFLLPLILRALGYPIRGG